MTETLHTTEDSIQMDRRNGESRRKESSDRRKQDVPVAADRRKGERRNGQRRRQIDPTTCERDYSGDEIEFMQALDAYKRSSGRMFPTCSEILEVIRSIGYVKLAEDGAPIQAEISNAIDESDIEEEEFAEV